MTARPRALALLAAAAAARPSDSRAAPPASETTGSGERVDGGTIVYAHQQEPACVFGGWIEQAYLSYNVLDSLVSLDENHEVVPWLAEAWSVSDDGLQLDLRAEARREVHRRHRPRPPRSSRTTSTTG